MSVDNGVMLGPEGLHGGLLGEEQVRRFHADGYLVLKQLCKSDTLAAIRDQSIVCWDAIKGKECYSPDNTWLQNAL